MGKTKVNAADIIEVIRMIPSNHSARFMLIDLMNTALIKRALPDDKADMFHIICKSLIEEGWL